MHSLTTLQLQRICQTSRLQKSFDIEKSDYRKFMSSFGEVALLSLFLIVPGSGTRLRNGKPRHIPTKWAREDRR